MEDARFSPRTGHTDRMGKKRRILSALLLVAGAVGVALLALRPTEPSEPIYQGKPLSVWLKEGYGSPPLAPASVSAAENALRALGTNALPFLTTMAASRDSPLKTGLIHLARKQHFFKVNITRADERRGYAMSAFHFLRADAKSAIPALIKPLNDGESAEAVAFILADIGPDGLGPLTNALTNSDWKVRASVVIGLGRFAKPYYRDEYPVSPSELDSLAKIIVPVLVNSLHDPDLHVRHFAAMSLGWFASEDESICVEAALALEKCGAEAQDAVPGLLQALRKQHGVSAVSNALKAIDPAAAAKAGIK
jgi:HEAT repeat protein